MKRVRFYHSAICPRCRLSSHWLKGVLAEFPEVEIERIEFLRHRARARADGVRGIPALVAGERRLSGFLLTKSRLQRFLASI
tara:strand:+ start:950 stop:1195 length:246 start_codon:yes stop_codon:yes gene_type:complete